MAMFQRDLVDAERGRLAHSQIIVPCCWSGILKIMPYLINSLFSRLKKVVRDRNRDLSGQFP
jgi:hypothetical protein